LVLAQLKPSEQLEVYEETLELLRRPRTEPDPEPPPPTFPELRRRRQSRPSQVQRVAAREPSVPGVPQLSDVSAATEVAKRRFGPNGEWESGEPCIDGVLGDTGEAARTI